MGFKVGSFKSLRRAHRGFFRLFLVCCLTTCILLIYHVFHSVNHEIYVLKSSQCVNFTLEDHIKSKPDNDVHLKWNLYAHRYLISLHNLKQKYLCKKFGLNQPYAHNFLFSLICNSILPRGKEIFILELWNAIIINYNVHNCVHFMLYSLLRLQQIEIKQYFCAD